MKTWAIHYEPDAFPDEVSFRKYGILKCLMCLKLFETALRLVDEESVTGLRKFFRKEDSVREEYIHHMNRLDEL